ncbi:alpha/beta fold hydrolase [Rhodococcus sp. NPDC127528]|uniref:alpha/beta fold hydrolase n=1 Tax=unclassified Rhodococcus (in: high G+C Gram-positive bacteria) TaxID=192944 RepID=UPI0036334E43
MASTAAGWNGYLRSAARRGATPAGMALDCVEFWRAATRRRPTRFAHPNTVRRVWPLARLREFSPIADGSVATLVLPPMSGHASTVVDLTADRSLIATVRDAGLTGAHCLEWLSTGAQSSPTGIDDVVAVISAAIEDLGGTVNLVGYSQGGWLATVYAALHPAQVHTLTVAAAPIDFALGIPGTRNMPGGRPDTELPGLATACRATGVPPASAAATALRLAEWPEEWARLMDLWAHIGDPARVAAHVAFESWLDAPQKVPPDFYRWTALHLFLRNELVRGELEVSGRVVDLGAIACPLFLLAGTRDRIVHARQLWVLADHVSTSRNRITRRAIDTGHLEMITDPGVLREHWLPILREVAELSGT